MRIEYCDLGDLGDATCVLVAWQGRVNEELQEPGGRALDSRGEWYVGLESVCEHSTHAIYSAISRLHLGNLPPNNNHQTSIGCRVRRSDKIWYDFAPIQGSAWRLLPRA